MNHARWSVLLVAFLSACTGEVTDQEDGVIEEGAAEEDAVAEAEDAILEGQLSYSYAGIVRLETPQGSCTATVLTEHWLLTAAHCIDDLPVYSSATVRASVAGASFPTPRVVYDNGPVELFVPSSYDGDRPYDVGLVHLRSHGIDTSVIGRAKLHAGSSGAPTSSMRIAGYGRGSAPGGTTNCDNATSGLLRVRDQAVKGSNSTVAWASDTLHCPGDSGGPWMSYVSSQSIQFAVHGGWGWSLSLGYYDDAATIASTRVWIEDRMKLRIPHRFVWSASSSAAGGIPYRTYQEKGVVFSPLRIGGWCVEPDGTGAGSPLVLRACNGSWTQLWLLDQTGKVTNFATNLCMDVNEASTAPGTKVQLWGCHGGPNQLFRHTSDGRIHYGMAYNMCIDLPWNDAHDGAALQTWGCNTSGGQVFSFD